ncbi:MAG TPA: response regulator [Abditibacteriaceae bacterium]|jgi:signal transduction histidine kinase
MLLESSSGEPSAPKPASFGRILIVDDTPLNVRLLSSILEIEGYSVVTASNGPDALKLVPETEPDVVLLDVMMPGMDGFEVCRRLRADAASAHLPVVMVTALQDMPNRVQALEAGADDFLTKPVDEVEVLARVKTLVRTKRGRDELENAYRALQRSEGLRDSLSQMLVHDLRTPLTAMIASLDIMLTSYRERMDDIQLELLEMCMNSCRHMVNQVSELLDVGKLESGALELNRESVTAEPLMTTALSQVQSLARNRNIQIAEPVAVGVPQFQADAELLRRVLVNLIGNSLKFCPSGSHLAVEATTQEDFVLFSVRDDGPGIAPENRERIFDKWGQAESSSAGRKLSSGLGLTFCRLAVEAHGGKIWVESEVGKGSDFRFTIPLAHSEGE